jgi:hypothetical protein
VGLHAQFATAAFAGKEYTNAFAGDLNPAGNLKKSAAILCSTGNHGPG